MNWDALSALAAVVGNLVAVGIAILSLRRADAALAQAHAIAEDTARRHFAAEGAASAIAWRQQVLDLHDRGLTPGQIRRIMMLEQGGEGYERGNGCIDEILRDVP